MAKVIRTLSIAVAVVLTIGLVPAHATNGLSKEKCQRFLGNLQDRWEQYDAQQDGYNRGYHVYNARHAYMRHFNYRRILRVKRCIYILYHGGGNVSYHRPHHRAKWSQKWW